VKPSFTQLASAAGMDKNVFHKALLNLFQVIGELLSESHNVEIDLKEFGIL
jgi:hypothetical protein